MAATLRGYVSRKGPRLQASQPATVICVHSTQHVCTFVLFIRCALVIVSTCFVCLFSRGCEYLGYTWWLNQNIACNIQGRGPAPPFPPTL